MKFIHLLQKSEQADADDQKNDYCIALCEFKDFALAANAVKFPVYASIRLTFHESHVNLRQLCSVKEFL